MKYILTSLEEDVKELYKYLHIQSPNDIDMYNIANDLDIWIHYHKDDSKLFKSIYGLYSIFLDERLSEQEQWQDFGHELCHAIKHVGNQDAMRYLFRCLQESQANNFMYHFCVPTFLLLEMNISNYLNIEDGVEIIASTFNVTKEFARKRLEMFRNQIMQAKADEEHRRYMESRYPKAPPYSDETNKILERAFQYKAKKGMVNPNA
ncbi:ImmA/IrrE family metallo-endopeptidase [Bacillus sp. JJ722]|uniref:ImmA/IrrE family metallo-endopeptidase n=1 Tax=Bacillus sp. JJ722 TaxID=3122973 RepID=UPI003000E2AB